MAALGTQLYLTPFQCFCQIDAMTACAGLNLRGTVTMRLSGWLCLATRSLSLLTSRRQLLSRGQM